MFGPTSSDMILLCVDHWVGLVDGDQYEIVEFLHQLVLRPGASVYNRDDALFGMSYFERFGSLKAGIAHHFRTVDRDISLFWNNNELHDDETPDTVGMETCIAGKESIIIHITGSSIED